MHGSEIADCGRRVYEYLSSSERAGDGNGVRDRGVISIRAVCGQGLSCLTPPPPWPGSLPSFLPQKRLSRGGARFFLLLKRLSPFRPPFSRKMASSLQIPHPALRIQNQLPPLHIHTPHNQTERNTNMSRLGVPILNPLLSSSQF